MINQDLVIFNNTTFLLPEIVPIVSNIIPKVLNTSQTIKRKGYSAIEVLITVRDVYKWVTGVPMLPLQVLSTLGVPGGNNSLERHTKSFIEVSSKDPYPEMLLNIPSNTDYIIFKMLRHIYTILDADNSIGNKLLKGMMKRMKAVSAKKPKNIILLSFPPELRFVAEFILYHFRAGKPLYADNDESPMLMELSSVDVNDAWNRRIMAMRTEDIAASFTKAPKRLHVSHINTSPHTHSHSTSLNSRLTGMRVDEAHFIFDLSQADYKIFQQTNQTKNQRDYLLSAVVEEEFKKVSESFIKVCISRMEKITASN